MRLSTVLERRFGLGVGFGGFWGVGLGRCGNGLGRVLGSGGVDLLEIIERLDVGVSGGSSGLPILSLSGNDGFLLNLVAAREMGSAGCLDFGWLDWSGWDPSDARCLEWLWMTWVLGSGIAWIIDLHCGGCNGGPGSGSCIEEEGNVSVLPTQVSSTIKSPLFENSFPDQDRMSLEFPNCRFSDDISSKLL